MTGMEAISNSVSIFRDPQVRNARTTLALMASILGVMFVGVSVLAAMTHTVPFSTGTPTVLSEIGRAVFGHSAIGDVPFLSLQFSTALILILGANTSFNGFPLLVSFIATDAYLPRPLTTRGHRLVYSNGILALSFASLLLLVVTRAQVASLIPLYASTVFTGFTMAGAGMTKYHLTHRAPHRRRNLAINGTAFVASATVTGIFVVTEFTRGAWLVVVAIPLIVLGLTRTHHRYEMEKQVLAEDLAAPPAAEPTLRRHVVIVLVDRLDMATARALQLARSLTSTGDVRAVHFAVDPARAARISNYWRKPGLANIPLEIVECPDRRIVRGATELAAELAANGETEVTLVLPRRVHRGVASRLLHDRTSDRIVSAVNHLPHVSATIAPFDVAGLLRQRAREPRDGALLDPRQRSAKSRMNRRPIAEPRRLITLEGTTPLGELTYRQRAFVAGRVHTLLLQPGLGVPTLECTIVDDSGAIIIVFLGRRSVPGLEAGAWVSAEGMVGKHRGQLAMINPRFDLLAEPGVGKAVS